MSHVIAIIDMWWLWSDTMCFMLFQEKLELVLAIVHCYWLQC